MDVAVKLLERAQGAITVKQQGFKVKDTIYNDQGRKVSEEERIEVVDLVHQEAPDTTALIFWLKNRKSSQWRDKVAEDSNPTEKEITINVVRVSKKKDAD